MKKLVNLFLISSAIVIACHKKTIPEMTARTNFPDAPRSAQLPVDNSPESIAAGKTIFETRCTSCHELKDTRIYSADRWSSILKNMIPRAKLNNQEAKQVASYVMANAKK